jgi:5-(carboxyamino)imidazole ribonucleotide mutase
MKIQIILGSSSDMPVAEKAKKILDQFTVNYDVNIASAHRTPDIVEDIIKKSDADVFIGIAGLAAALPGAMAAHTIKPVIGVPVSGKVNFDSILSIIQMPPGIPIAAVGLDRGDNAALLALEILGLQDKTIEKELKKYRQQMREKVLNSN